MATLKGATFEIVSGDRSCPMYDDPDGTHDNEPFTPRKYIEAVTDRTFEVHVTFDARFDYFDCDAVLVCMRFDGSSDHHSKFLTRMGAMRVPNQRQVVRFALTTRYCADTRQWHRSMFTFGKLEIKESSGSSLSRSDIKGLGKIQLSYQRINYVGKSYDAPRRHACDRVSEVSEKVLKGKSIENTIETVPFQAVATRPIDKHIQSIPIPGDAGKRVELEVVYRSKRTLQMLGCIPRSPSPDPNIDLTTRSQPSSSVSVKEELTTLRARLAELERQANSTPEPTLKPESKRAISAIKREMGDKQNQRSAKRSRQSGPIETIDLTDD